MEELSVGTSSLIALCSLALGAAPLFGGRYGVALLLAAFPGLSLAFLVLSLAYAKVVVIRLLSVAVLGLGAIQTGRENTKTWKYFLEDQDGVLSGVSVGKIGRRPDGN